jgi:hypothetical protein
LPVELPKREKRKNIDKDTPYKIPDQIVPLFLVGGEGGIRTHGKEKSLQKFSRLPH